MVGFITNNTPHRFHHHLIYIYLIYTKPHNITSFAISSNDSTFFSVSKSGATAFQFTLGDCFLGTGLLAVLPFPLTHLRLRPGLVFLCIEFLCQRWFKSWLYVYLAGFSDSSAKRNKVPIARCQSVYQKLAHMLDLELRGKNGEAPLWNLVVTLCDFSRKISGLSSGKERKQ